MTTRFFIGLLCFCLSALSVQAVTITAVSPSFSDVLAAVSSAARGDTVVVPSGSGTVTWSNTLSLTKGIFLSGPGRDNLAITCTGTCISVAPDSTAIANEEIIRVERFTFDGNNSTSANFEMISVTGAGVNSSKPFKNLVIGNNRFKNGTTITSGSGIVSTHGQVRGVIYSNIFDRCGVILKIIGNDDPTEWGNGHFPLSFGTADNLYFESNTIQYSSSYSGQDPGWSETGQGARLVYRYNTLNFTNTTCSEYWDMHGFQNWQFGPTNGQTGTMVSEYYGNTLTNTSGYRWVAFRGGWGLVFNNIMTGTNGGAIEAWDQSGECCELVPLTGTTLPPSACGTYDTRVNNTYVFNNTVGGSVKNMVICFCQPDGVGCAAHPTLENQQFWNYNASFTGATGIGRGTSNPPNPTPTPVDGVGYWKCSTVTPTTDPTIVQTGHLYKRVAGAWVDYYTPYTYPHPLASGTPPPNPTPTPGGTVTPTPTPTPPPTPTPGATATPAPLGTSFDAIQGVITSPFVINSNAVSQPILTTDPTQGGKALYTFSVSTSGDYSLSALVNCPDEGSNSLFVNIDAEPTTAMVWNIPVTSGFELRIASWSPSTTPKLWTLTAGTHQLIFRGREANTVLQHITLGIAPQAPEGLHVVP